MAPVPGRTLRCPAKVDTGFAIGSATGAESPHGERLGVGKVSAASSARAGHQAVIPLKAKIETLRSNPQSCLEFTAEH